MQHVPDFADTIMVDAAPIFLTPKRMGNCEHFAYAHGAVAIGEGAGVELLSHLVGVAGWVSYLQQATSSIRGFVLGCKLAYKSSEQKP